MILVVGANGFLGRRVVQALEDADIQCLRASHDPANSDIVIDLAKPIGSLSLPDGVTHAVILSSITSIDECFKEPDRTSAFNVTHTIELIDHLSRSVIQPVFISSDVVFEGTRGNYREDETARPVTEYGRQKRTVEIHLEEKVPNHLIVRLGKLYTLKGDDNSPVSGIIRDLNQGCHVNAATDQFLTPTVAEEVAESIVRLIGKSERGIFHLVPGDGGALSRYDMAIYLADAIGADRDLVRRCSIHDFDFAEPRPVNSTLNGEKFQAFSGLRLTPFTEQSTL